MKSTNVYCLAMLLLALQLTTVSCYNRHHRKFKRQKSLSVDWSPQTPISLVPLPDETERLKEALELLNMGKKTLGLGTEPPEALLAMAGNPDDKAKAKGIDKILQKPKDNASMGNQILVMRGKDKERMSIENFVNSTLDPKEEMAIKSGGNVQDFFKMQIEKRSPAEHGDVYHKITIMQSNKQGPYNGGLLRRKKRFRKRMAPLLLQHRGRRKREGEMMEGSSFLKVNNGGGIRKEGRREFGHEEPIHHGGGFWSKIQSFFDFLKPSEKPVTERPWSAFSLVGPPLLYGGGIEGRRSGGYLDGRSFLNQTASHIEALFMVNDTLSQNLKLNDSIHVDGSREKPFTLGYNISNLKTLKEENSNGKGSVDNNIVLTSNMGSSVSTRNPDSATEVKMLKMDTSSSVEIFPAEISKRKSRSKDDGPVENIVSLDVVRQAEFQGGRFPYQRETWHENQLYFSGLIGACMMFLVVVCIVTGVIVFRKIDRKDQDFSAGNLNLKGKHLILKLSGEEGVLNDDFFFKERKEMAFKRPFYSNYWKKGRYIPLHNEEDDFDFAGLDWQSEMGEWLSDGELSK